MSQASRIRLYYLRKHFLVYPGKLVRCWSHVKIYMIIINIIKIYEIFVKKLFPVYSKTLTRKRGKSKTQAIAKLSALHTNARNYKGNCKALCVKDIINPYDCLLKNANFLIKTTND